MASSVPYTSGRPGSHPGLAQSPMKHGVRLRRSLRLAERLLQVFVDLVEEAHGGEPFLIGADE